MIYDTPPSLPCTAITIYHLRAKAGEHGGQINNCNSAFTANRFWIDHIPMYHYGRTTEL